MDHLPHEDRGAAVHDQPRLAKGRVVVDRWEEGFDSWKPSGRTEAAADDTGVEIDVDRETLLRLARELAEQRHDEQERARAELEQLKQALRERAEAVAARERELEELARRGEKPKREKKKEQQQQPPRADEALVARERAALERAQALEARERELQERQAALEAQAAEIGAREEALRAELDAARSERSQSESERQLAAAERDRLEEREQEARRIEKELAARRIELEGERDRLEVRAREVAARVEPETDPYAAREDELRALETKLDEREQELALMRQGLDSERNVLLERERALRRREVADVRQTFGAPFAPPSFSEGLAAFARSRPRR